MSLSKIYYNSYLKRIELLDDSEDDGKGYFLTDRIIKEYPGAAWKLLYQALENHGIKEEVQ